MPDHSPLTEPRSDILSGVIPDAEHWHGFMARMEAVRAHNDKLPDYVRKHRICERDTVSITRELMVKTHHIPRGSLGVVTVERDNGRLLEVRFFCDPDFAITICERDLQRVA
jgi:hypothetical protein